MRDWIVGFVGEDMATGAMLVVVTLAIVLAFLLLFAIFKGFSGTGVRGNRRSRQARLAVMDAAIVDSRRRLVLIRRDDTEHLILIGGPTDVVVEQNINRLQQPKSTKTQHPRAQATPAHQPSTPIAPPARDVAPMHDVGQTQPLAQPLENPAPRIPAAPAVSNRPTPVQSPQIRPATKPPAPVAAIPPIDPPVSNPAAPAPVSPPSAPIQKPAVMAPPPAPVATTRVTAPPASPPTASIPPNTVSNSAMPGSLTNPGKPSSRGPVLAQASASSVAAAPIAAAALNTPPADSVIDDVAENQLADFEDNLAMNLGETLIQEETQADKDSLASEMDELLSEITSSGKS